MDNKRSVSASEWAPFCVRIHFDEDYLKGAVKMGRTWIIPKGTLKPIDGRTEIEKEVRCNKK